MLTTQNEPVICVAGDELLFTLQLTASGVPTDASAGVFSYGIPAANNPVVVPFSALAHIGNGTYTCTLDTANLIDGLYVAQALATGAVVAADVELFIVQARPLG